MSCYRYSFVDSTAEAADCDGHGTHVSATIAGRAVGVAKDAEVVAVKVLDCQGRGTVSDVIAGLNWVAQHATRPAIVTMSLVGKPQGHPTFYFCMGSWQSLQRLQSFCQVLWQNICIKSCASYLSGAICMASDL